MLGDRAGADVEVLRQAFHRLDQRLRQHQPAQAPAGHAEVFREAVDRDDVVTEGQRAALEGRVVAQALVDLVDDGDAVLFAHDVDDARELVGRDRRAGRVRRRGQQHAARLRRPVLAHVRRVELEARLGCRRHQPRAGAGGRHEVPVARIARVRHQHLVAGLEQRLADELQPRRRARGDDDAPRRHVHAPAARVPAADALTQRGQADGVGVLGAAGAQRDLRGGDDGRGRGEVRLADVQVDHRLAAERRIAFGGARDLLRHLGALHHVERIDVGQAAGELHAVVFSQRPLACTSTGRRSAAVLSRTPLTYLWPSVPPKLLASSTASLIATLYGMSMQCFNS